MSDQDKVSAPVYDLLKPKTWVGGAGGSRAVLADSGALMACHIAGITWGRKIGISGGALPALALATGMHPLKLGQLAVDVDFNSLVPRHATPLHMFAAFLLRDRFEYTRPKRGVLSSEKLGHFIRDLVRSSGVEVVDQESLWVRGFVTAGVVGRTQLIFTENGVIQALRDGSKKLFHPTPAPIDIAIRATCAVPGIIDAAHWQGRYIFDGALSWDGQCPVGIPMRHYGVDATDIIACDVGDEQHRFANTFRWFWSLVCGGHCVDHAGPKTEIPDGVLMMKPNVWSVRSLQFNLTIEQKWQAVMSGFQEAVLQLTASGMLVGDAKKRAFAICMDLAKLQALSNEAG